MADWLLLRFPRSPEQDSSWIVVDARGGAQTQPMSGPLSLAAAQAGSKRLCVLVPASDVLLAEPELPPRAGAKLQQVVPYALEEQLAQDIDELHFAIGKRAGDSPRVPVAVVSRSLMDEWVSTLLTAGLRPEAMYADSDLLPRNPGHAVALMEEDTVIVRPPTGSPITMPADALPEALELVQPTADEMTSASGRGLLLYAGPAEWHVHSQQVEGLREHFDGIKVQLLTNGPLTLFAQQLPEAAPVNLLQGPYTPSTPMAEGWRAWRAAAILLVSLLGLHVAGRTAELVLLKRTESTLDASIDEAFRTAMPGEQNTADARRRMERRLMDLRGGTSSAGLLPALGALVEARTGAPGTVVQALSYRDGALDLKIAAPDANSLDRVSQSLRGSGWQADLTSGNVAGSAYEGRIQIRPGGPS